MAKQLRTRMPSSGEESSPQPDPAPVPAVATESESRAPTGTPTSEVSTSISVSTSGVVTSVQVIEPKVDDSVQKVNSPESATAADETKETTTLSDANGGATQDGEEDSLPPEKIEVRIPTEAEVEYAGWRARLHLQNFQEELELLLAFPKTAGPLRAAAANTKCQLPGNVQDWNPIKAIREVLDRMLGKSKAS